MAVIKNVLKEELENSKRLAKRYSTELKKLPKGSLVAKKIKNGIYYYLQYREGDKRHYRYLGKISQKEIEKYQEAKEMRAHYRKLLSDVKKQIAFLERSIRAKSI